MGADLTIVETDRYFRDSYNDTMIFAVLGLSYWQFSKVFEEKKWFTDKRTITKDAVKHIYNKVILAKFDEETIKLRLKQIKAEKNRESAYIKT